MRKNYLSFFEKSEVKFQNPGKDNGLELQNEGEAMTPPLVSAYVNQPVAFNECFYCVKLKQITCNNYFINCVAFNEFFNVFGKINCM